MIPAAGGMVDVILGTLEQPPEKPPEKPREQLRKISAITIRITRTQVIATITVPLPEETEVWT